jgi:hypothetical protein
MPTADIGSHSAASDLTINETVSQMLRRQEGLRREQGSLLDGPSFIVAIPIRMRVDDLAAETVVADLRTDATSLLEPSEAEFFGGVIEPILPPLAQSVGGAKWQVTFTETELRSGPAEFIDDIDVFV